MSRIRVPHGDGCKCEDCWEAPTQPAIPRLMPFTDRPPDPLPEVLPVGTRTHEGGGMVFESEATLTEWGSRPHYRALHPAGQFGLFEASDIDWAHYRAQQAQAERPWSREAPPDSEGIAGAAVIDYFDFVVLGLSRAELVYVAHAQRRALRHAELRAKLARTRFARMLTEAPPARGARERAILNGAR